MELLSFLLATLLQPHVIVDNPPVFDPAVRTQTWFIALGAIASAAAAFGTLYLALKTRKLADETKRLAEATVALNADTVAANQWADRHFQESQIPLVYLDASVIIEGVTLTSKSGDRAGYCISLRGLVCNIGGGPAVSVNVLVKPMGFTTRAFHLGLIGPNATRELSNIEWTFERTDYYEHGRPVPFETRLRYASTFDTSGETRQRSHSGLGKDLIADHVQRPKVTLRTIESPPETMAATYPRPEDFDTQ